MELIAEVLLRKADELLVDQRDAGDVIHLCRAAAVLYQGTGQLNLAIVALMRIAVGLQDSPAFYQEAIQAYQEVASIHKREGNQEGCSNALMSAAFAAQKLGDTSLATNLFLEAEQEYKSVADAYWNQRNYELAWDNMQLAYRCLKSTFISAGASE